MISNGSLKEQVRRILLSHQGHHDAIRGKEIAHRLGLKDDRSVRLVIRDLITDGYPIASATESPPGFFIATNRDEVETYAKSLRKRLIEDAIRRRDFLRASRSLLKPGQLKLMVGV